MSAASFCRMRRGSQNPKATSNKRAAAVARTIAKISIAFSRPFRQPSLERLGCFLWDCWDYAGRKAREGRFGSRSSRSRARAIPVLMVWGFEPSTPVMRALMRGPSSSVTMPVQ